MFCILVALWPNRTVGIKPMEGRSARERMGGKTSQQHGWSDATLHHLITQVGKVRPKSRGQKWKSLISRSSVQWPKLVSYIQMQNFKASARNQQQKRRFKNTAVTFFARVQPTMLSSILPCDTTHCG